MIRIKLWGWRWARQWTRLSSRSRGARVVALGRSLSPARVVDGVRALVDPLDVARAVAVPWAWVLARSVGGGFVVHLARL